MRYWLWLAAGFGLLWLSRGLEAVGDSFAHADKGVSWDRLVFHGTALLVLLGGMACFLRAGKLIYHAIRGKAVPAIGAPERLTAPAAVPQAPPEFDADAALQRYLSGKEQQGETRPAGPRPMAGGFGRRGL